MKVSITSYVPSFQPGAYEVWFAALDDNGAPLKGANGAIIHDGAKVSIIVNVAPNEANELPTGNDLDAAILLEVSRFARRRILPASSMTSGALAGIVDLASEPAAADAPPQP